jgi:hypothetical protein
MSRSVLIDMLTERAKKSGLQLQIAALDRAIDSLVFCLYDIGPDEGRSISSSP